jgi:hypothetical protein
MQHGSPKSIFASATWVMLGAPQFSPNGRGPVLSGVARSGLLSSLPSSGKQFCAKSALTGLPVDKFAAFR